jgi:hypothetical protein
VAAIEAWSRRIGGGITEGVPVNQFASDEIVEDGIDSATMDAAQRPNASAVTRFEINVGEPAAALLRTSRSCCVRR